MAKKYYRAKHILVEYAEDAEYIKKQIDAGSSFESMAQKYSECSSSEQGGDLGKFSSGMMVAEFEKALYDMKPGEIKSAVKTKFGYHIILRQE